MFWNRSDKSSLAEKNEQPVTKESINKTTIKLPLTFLKRLVPIGNLPFEDIKQLLITVSHHKAGDIIFNYGEESDSLTYLYKGQCFVETRNNISYEVNKSTLKAYYPLSSSSTHQYRVIAKSDVSILHFSHDVFKQSTINTHNALLNIDDVPEHLQNNTFFKKFCEFYQEGELTIPSLPNVSLKLRAAVQKDIGIGEAVQIVNLDPVISSKLIQIVNSPYYRTANPISSCHNAINRLGLVTTRNLVTSLSMQNLFKSKNKELNTLIHNNWKQSIKVSSISQTLSASSKSINADEALLAGLVHNIGRLPILIFADSLNSDEYTLKDLNQTSAALQGILGNIILGKWKFPDNLNQIPRQAENWYYNEGLTLNLTDVVVLARFHSFIGSKQMQNLPAIQTLPAFQKLGDNALTPDMSLQTLHDAKQQIADAMNLF